ncbi:tetratricopeptide repeat protein [Fulvivirgaceae bacterium PWU4]|uniref:histidine kinase n=1 Tax=Chryseosolibacter histidini TaxID=2782349 RepID=A0AAP2DJJ6_9BACT|nr:tetratricopeptide repeat protein [Chryseosolibacter histidini]MBT1697440.1 tetratricopeptide repeat protein [Chryseosolibacter histidini]
MSRRIVFLLISACLGWSAYGQGKSKVTDSLEQMLPKAQGPLKVDILNRLTYEFITHDNNKVETYNKEARDLGKSIHYLKGEARAYTYRGVYEYLSGRLSEGHADLNRGLELAIQAGDEQLRGYTLLQLGVCSLEEVQMDSALHFFKKSREVFKDSADPVTLSKLYRNISALYGQRYQTDSQQYYLDRAISIRRLLPDKTLLTEAIILKANTRVRFGDFAGAEKLLKQAAELVGPGANDEENRNDILHMQALILFQKGKFEQAVVAFDSARNYFFRKTLLHKYVTLLIDLGKVFADRGEYELALNNLYDALRLSGLRGFEAESGIIRIEIGRINHHLGDPRQAMLMADEALRLDRRKLLRGDLANALSLKGIALTDVKDYTAARQCLDSALKIYTDLGSVLGKSEARRSLGYLEGKRKRYGEALQHYQESIRLAESITYRYGLAWSCWATGDIYFRQGDLKNALLFLDRSLDYARHVGSNEVIVRNYNTRRDLLTAQGRYQEALKYSTLANVLNDSIHRTDVARRFVNLEKIREIEQRDRDIKVLQQDKLLAQDKLQLQAAQLKQQSILLVAGVVGLLLLSVLAIMYYRFYTRIKALNVSVTDKNTRIQAQADKLKQYNLELKQLYREVSEQKEEIQMQADKLTETNRNMTDVNRSLEKIVTEKTVELRRTNDELMKYNAELLQFSYTVSHNLRGPVARLLGLADLADKEHDFQQVKQLIDFIGVTAHDLDLIIKDLSKILELRNNPHQAQEVVALASEWEQSKSLLQDSLTGNEEIVANFEDLPAITTVRPMLQSIFYNLLSNAIKFKSPERRLKVVATSQRVNGKAILEISDNGLGFNIRLHHEKLFKLYKRFHTHVEGRGLGLYLIKSQVEVLQGTIEVDSEPDKGSAFRIILPISNGESHGEIDQ